MNSAEGFALQCYSLSCVYVCLCIRLFPLWLLQRPLKPTNNGTHGFLLGFSWINMCGVSKKPSVEKLWREKANMQMSWNSPRAVFAHFRDQRKAGTTRRVTGQSRVASPATYRCKWPKTTEILGLHKSVYFPESVIICARPDHRDAHAQKCVVHFFLE